jgi:NitT/TauT family transport system substrate-binding protein
MQIMQNRRRFLTNLSLAGAAGLVGFPRSIAAEDPAAAGVEPPPETATIRLIANTGACTAPLYLAEKPLHEEGFAEVRYVPVTGMSADMLADGDVDFSMEDGFDYLPLVNVGKHLTLLAGVHVGCFELRANHSIQGIVDLRGKKVGINHIGGPDHLLVSAMAAYVGLDPVTEIHWVTDPTISQVELFSAGKIDAFIGFPPNRGQVCAMNVGHVVYNMADDPPWSNYFCCMVAANSDFVRNNPAATKRALRAILRATDFCHEHPERAARRMVDFGFSHECALQTLNATKYGLWRDFNPEDAVRFFALRMHEAGMITKSPKEVISEFTNWRFLEEVKRELKT